MTSELKRRIAFTLGALLVYRLGLFIPLPGIDLSVWTQIFRAQSGGVLGNLFWGGGLHRLAIFALNIMPYISAAVILQLATIISRKFAALKKQGERGRQIIDRRTRYLTVLLAALQASAVAVALEGVAGLVAYPAWLFVMSTVITLTGGTMSLVWLSEQISLRGIGNGVALILVAGIVTELPGTIAGTLELGRQGLLSGSLLVALLMMVVAVTGFIALMQRAQRRFLIQYPERRVGPHMIEGRSSYLTLRLNTAGVIPVVLASWLLLVPIAFAIFSAGQGPGWLTTIATRLEHGRPLYLILYAILIVLCTFFYTAFVFDPEETAESLKGRGGFIQGIEPGEATAEHIDYVVSRTAVIGSAYLALVCLIPEVLISSAAVPFYFGGTSLLIVVSTILDLEAQIQGYLRLKPRG